MRAVHADAIVTGDAETLRDGAVIVDAAGVVVEVGAAAGVLPRHAGAPVERVRGVLLPGLVNAHTHLELSGLRGRVPGGAGFVPWAEGLLVARDADATSPEGLAIDAAVAELTHFGTAAVGDVTNTLA